MKLGVSRSLRALLTTAPGLLLLGGSLGMSAQDNAQNSQAASAASEGDVRMILAMRTGDTHLAPTPPSGEGKLSPWFELQTASLSTRYHYIRNTGGVTGASNNQYQLTLQGRLKLDRTGKYAVHAGVFTGNGFTGGWNNSGWGTGRARSNVFLKQLYFSAQPAAGVEVQYGGLEIASGQSTEVTAYDSDGYIVGQRLRLARPKNFYFDEISVTYAYLGDLDRAGVSRRFRRLRESNYHQFLLAKNFGKRIRASADYTFDSGVDTLRQAIRLRAPELRVVETLLFENYQRLGADSGYGFGVYGEKKLHPRLSLGGGYAQIDRVMLNSDRFLQGKRVHLNGHVTLSPEFSISLAAAQAVDRTAPGLPRTRLDVAFQYNLLHRLRKTELF